MLGKKKETLIIKYENFSGMGGVIYLCMYIDYV